MHGGIHEDIPFLLFDCFGLVAGFPELPTVGRLSFVAELLPETMLPAIPTEAFELEGDCDMVFID
jgi:hypothetical protein